LESADDVYALRCKWKSHRPVVAAAMVKACIVGVGAIGEISSAHD
jgi:hypothetical protein